MKFGSNTSSILHLRSMVVLSLMASSPIGFESAKVSHELMGQQRNRFLVHAGRLQAPQHVQILSQSRSHQGDRYQLTVKFLDLANTANGSGTGITALVCFDFR